MRELHEHMFVYRHIIRPSSLGGNIYNIKLTQDGLSLIEVGDSLILGETNKNLFQGYVNQEMQDFLNQ